jgi:formate dehydrogenase subunit gamma
MPRSVRQRTSQPSRPATITRSISASDANAAAKKLVTAKDGSVTIKRFSLLNRGLHFLLLLAVTGLAFTGLAEIMYKNALGKFFLTLLGGLENTQAIHHSFAGLLAFLAVFHGLDIIESLFVRRQTPAMLPGWLDLQAFTGMLALNLGISKKQPRFDRYNYEEKAVYWLLAFGIILLGISGIIQLYPIQVTEFLPGIIIPYAGIFHRWEAILVMLVVFVWHLYQVLYRKPDGSIFSGRKSRADMLMEHPLELEYLEKSAQAVGGTVWPLNIELYLSEDLTGHLSEDLSGNLSEDPVTVPDPTDAAAQQPPADGTAPKAD